MTNDTFPAFDSWAVEAAGEPLVGVTVCPHQHADGKLWLSWDETVQLHQWLSELIKAGAARAAE